MKTTIKKLFSLSVTDSEYFGDDQKKFELTSCPNNGNHCKEILPAINKDYNESQLYRRNKMYQNSVDSLRSAYNSTIELSEPACAACAQCFRSSINQSLINVQNEMKKRSVPLFNFKFSRIGFLKLENALKEF